MSDKVQLIKQEIERLKHTSNAYDRSRFMLLLEIEGFIDSLPEEPANEDLENQYKSNICYQHAYMQDDLMKTKNEDLEEAASKYVREDFHERSRADFKAGAEWQKQKDLQDFLNKACEWLSKQPMSRPVFWTVEDFKNYIQDE